MSRERADDRWQMTDDRGQMTAEHELLLILEPETPLFRFFHHLAEHSANFFALTQQLFMLFVRNVFACEGSIQPVLSFRLLPV